MDTRTINSIDELIRRKNEINEKLLSLTSQIRESDAINTDAKQQITLQILQIQESLIQLSDAKPNFNVSSGTLWRELQNILNFAKQHHIDSGYVLEKTDSMQEDKKFNLPNSDFITIRPKYSIVEINDWLFNKKENSNFPDSQLNGRTQEKYKPKTMASNLAQLGKGSLTSRIHIHSGGITDLQIEPDKTGAIATSNNGDLLTGCGFAVAKAVVNAAGAGLQAELYNRFGVPGVMDVPKFGRDEYHHTEGRGYSITCDSYDLKSTHNINKIEVLTVPMHSEEGVDNMYYQALVNSKDLDYILIPMAGMTHPVLNNDHDRSAMFAVSAVKRFINDYPESKLNVVFTIFNDPEAELSYKKYAEFYDTPIKNKNHEIRVEYGPLAKSTATKELEELVTALALANQSEIKYENNIFAELEITIKGTVYNFTKILEHQADFEQLNLTNTHINAFVDHSKKSDLFSGLLNNMADYMVKYPEFRNMYYHTYNYLSPGEKLAALAYSDNDLYSIINNFLRYDGKDSGTYNYPNDIKGLILMIAVMHCIFKDKSPEKDANKSYTTGSGQLVRREKKHIGLDEQRTMNIMENREIINKDKGIQSPFVQKGFFSGTTSPDAEKKFLENRKDYHLRVIIHDTKSSNSMFKSIPSLYWTECERVAPHRSQYIFIQSSNSDVIEAIPIRSPTGINRLSYSRDEINTRKQLSELLSTGIIIPSNHDSSMKNISNAFAAINSFKDSYYLFVQKYDSLTKDEQSKETSRILLELKSLDDYLIASNTKENLQANNIFNRDGFENKLKEIIKNKISEVDAIPETNPGMLRNPVYYAIIADDKETYATLSKSYSEFDPRYKHDIATALLNNASEIATLITDSHGILPDYVDENNHLLLIRLMENNSDKSVEWLINKGINLDQPDEHGQTALAYAVEKGQINWVSLLLEAGASPDIADKDDHTPFHLAAKAGHTSIMGLLIDYSNMNLNAHDNQQPSPFYLASFYGHNKICESMLMQSLLGENHLDLNNQDKIHGWTQLHLAAQYGHTDVVKTLLNSGALNIKDNNGNTPFHLAVQNGHETVANEIFMNQVIKDSILSTIKEMQEYAKENGIYINTLHMAAILSSQDHHYEAVTFLLEWDETTKALKNQNDDINTILLNAAKNNWTDIVETLLQAGADINTMNSENCTALHIAAEENNLEMITLLLKNNANPNVRDIDSLTPLYLAALHQADTQVINALSNGNMKINKLDNEHYTQLHIAILNNHLSVAEALLKKGANPNAVDSKLATALHLAIENGNLDFIKALLGAGAIPNSHDINGCTPLHLAAKFGNHMAIKLLLEYHADPLLTNKEGLTPLYFATYNNKIDAIKELVNAYKPGDINKTNSRGETELHLASMIEGLNAITELLKAGADPAIKDIDGLTALDYAMSMGFLECAKELIKHELHQHLNTLVELNTQANDEMKIHLQNIHKSITESIINLFSEKNIGNIANMSNYLDSLRKEISLTTDEIYNPQSIDLMHEITATISGIMSEAKLSHEMRERKCADYLSQFELNKQDTNGLTLLHHATENGNLTLVEALLKAGANPDVMVTDGCTPLHLAAERGYHKIITLLLKYHADPFLSDSSGYTPLYFAAYNNKPDAIRALVENYKVDDINTHKDINGQTQLHLASMVSDENSINVVKELLKAGIDPALKDTAGNTALDYAMKYNNLDCAKELILYELNGHLKNIKQLTIPENEESKETLDKIRLSIIKTTRDINRDTERMEKNIEKLKEIHEKIQLVQHKIHTPHEPHHATSTADIDAILHIHPKPHLEQHNIETPAINKNTNKQQQMNDVKMAINDFISIVMKDQKNLTALDKRIYMETVDAAMRELSTFSEPSIEKGITNSMKVLINFTNSNDTAKNHFATNITQLTNLCKKVGITLSEQKAEEKEKEKEGETDTTPKMNR